MKTTTRSLPRLAGAAAVCCLAALGAATGAPVEYRYDALGRIVSVIYPGGQTVIYSYDAAGNRTTHVVQAATGNRAPDAVDDAKTWLDGVGTFTFDPRTNDSDPEAQAITIVGVSEAQYGATSFTASGVSYVAPNAHIVEKDGFSYTIQDSVGGRDSAVVSIDLGNLPPVAANDAISTAPNTAVTFNPLLNDSDPGAHGSTAFTGASVTYTPTPGYAGADSFTYTISDGDGGTATATVSATVSGVNNPPVAVNDSINVARGYSYTFNSCSNDSDPDGDPVTITAASQPSRGTRTWYGCSVSYLVSSGPAGSTSFTYTISDGRGGTSTATINITIELPL
jgi:large repetitive protein